MGETREAIGFDRVLTLIDPLSCYGKARKRELRPFMPGESAALAGEFSKVGACAVTLAAGEERPWQEIRNIFAAFPDIHEEMELVKGGLILHEINFFQIKKFIFLACALSRLLKITGLAPEEDFLALLPPEELRQAYINKNQGYQFYLGDYGDPAYLTLQKEIRGLAGLLAETEKKARDAAAGDLGREEPCFHSEYLYVSKSDPELLEKALHSSYWEKYRDFPTEICFVRKISSAEKKLKEQIAGKKREEEALELEIRKRLTGFTGRYVSYFDKAQKVIGEVDFLLAKARFMRAFSCTIPQIGKGKAIRLGQGINLPIQKELAEVDKEFMPVTMDFDRQGIVITGANMGGKTVALKTLGLLAAMAQHGIPVPARTFSFPLGRFLCYAGAFREKTGLSSFATEIEGLKMILHRRQEPGLVLLDEPARSTNPQEGLALVGAFLRKMAQGQPICVIVTHFEGLARMAGAEHWQVRGVRSVEKLLRREDLEKYFDYTLEKVGTDTEVPRDAIKVAELLGLEKEVLTEAKNLFHQIVKGGPTW